MSRRLHHVAVPHVQESLHGRLLDGLGDTPVPKPHQREERIGALVLCPKMMVGQHNEEHLPGRSSWESLLPARLRAQTPSGLVLLGHKGLHSTLELLICDHELSTVT